MHSAYLGLCRADIDVHLARVYLQAEVHERCPTLGQEVRVEALDILLERRTVH